MYAFSNDPSAQHPSDFSGFTSIVQQQPRDYVQHDSLSLMQDVYDPSSETGISRMTFLSPEHMTYICLNREETMYLQQQKKIHRHNYYELLYVIEGSVYQNIENTRHFYPKGSFCLMNTNIRHLEEYDGYCRVVFLQFSQEYIMELLQFPDLFHHNFTNVSSTDPHRDIEKGFQQMQTFFYADQSPKHADFRSYIDFIPTETAMDPYCFLNTITQEMHRKSPSSSFQIAATMIDLLSLLFDESCYANTPINLGTSQEYRRFEEISSYIRKQDGMVRRRDLEQAFHYSGDYIYKLVRKYTGMSLYDYSVQITLEKACDLLLNTRLNISSIMERLGFTNRTHFYKLFFDAYGTTPKDFRNHPHESR